MRPRPKRDNCFQNRSGVSQQGSLLKRSASLEIAPLSSMWISVVFSCSTPDGVKVEAMGRGQGR
jgi:hypothetical protein